MKYFLVVCALMVLPVFSHASTQDELLAKIKLLQEQIKILQTKVQVSDGAGSCLNLTQNLWKGKEGGDVTRLQTFLKSTGDYTYPEITGFYGNATELAVQRWQNKHNIVRSGSAAATGYGAVGPKTRAAIMRACSTGASSSTATPITSTTENSADVVAPTLSQNLWVGQKGSDVTRLQTFLKSTGDYTYPEITGYYGTATKMAVQKYQCRALNICSGSEVSTGYGVVGPATRKALREHVQKKVATEKAKKDSAETEKPENKNEEDTCYLDGVTLDDGEKRKFYRVEEVSAGSSCGRYDKIRVCNDGDLSGSSLYKYSSCVVEEEEGEHSCTLDGETISHGDAVTAYMSERVSLGEDCVSQKRTCTDGSLSGDASYQYDACVVVSEEYDTCNFDGTTLQHDQSVTAYVEEVTVPGGQCVSEQRTCDDGALSGSYTHSACTETPMYDEDWGSDTPVDFGFWQVDTGRDDPNDNTDKTDFTDEVAPFSSIVHMSQKGHPSLSFADKLERANSLGVRGVLGVPRLLFISHRLRSDYKELVDLFVENNEGYLNTKYIKALNFIDEPNWRYTNKVPTCGDVEAGATPYSELAEAAAYLKEKIPGVPLYFSESHNCAAELRIPPDVDYVSIHNYGPLDPAGWDAFNEEQGYTLNRVRTVANKLKDNQKLWLVMDAQYIVGRYEGRHGVTPEDMAEVTKNHWNMACRDEFKGKIDTIFAYRWPAGSAGMPAGILGARDFGPEVHDLYKQIYMQVKAGLCQPLQ